MNGLLAVKVQSQVQDQKYNTVFTKNCHESLCFHVVIPRKYIFLAFNLTFAFLMTICLICYTDVLKYLSSGWLIGYIYWVESCKTEGTCVDSKESGESSLLQNI